LKTADTYHHGHLRAELIRRGLEALETIGADVLSLRLLAEQAGVSKTAPYRHFKDKDEFLGALADEGFRLLHLKLENFAKDGPVGVAAMGRAYMDFAMAHPALYRLMNSPLVCRMPEGSMVWARRSLRLLGQTLARGTDAGEPGFDINAAAAAWAYIHGLVLIRIDGLFPADLTAPDWNLLASTIPRLD
jgi:AcrR family transcriptional regulator